MQALFFLLGVGGRGEGAKVLGSFPPPNVALAINSINSLDFMQDH